MDIEIALNSKCNVCKCYWKPTDADIKPSGLVSKSCTKCKEYQKEKRRKNKCEHGKIKSQCIPCGGSQICEHNRRKSRCVECGGSQICEHDKRKNECIECGGSSICEHDKRKSQCKECGGSQICEHNRIKSSCKICNFKQYLVQLQRGQIHRCLKNSNLDKTKPSIEYLDCSVEYFIEYFKKKMDTFNLYSEIEMTWDNIHIDHIKPVSKFNLDYTDEFLDCCHYTNLQPLLSVINLNKSNKWSEDDEVYWNEKIKGVEHIELYIPV